jgi:hypothetical protein
VRGLVLTSDYLDAAELAVKFLREDKLRVWVMRWRQDRDQFFVLTSQCEVVKVWAMAEVVQYIHPRLLEIEGQEIVQWTSKH